MTRVPAVYNTHGVYPNVCKMRLAVCYRSKTGTECEHFQGVTNGDLGPTTVLCSAPAEKGKP
jgi:hypothetical protein